MTKPGTSTSAFGVSKRENHDASAFYARFTSPVLSDDTSIGQRRDIDEIFLGDARTMSAIGSNTVALVVTSPPYFAGKQYEEELGEGHVPATYLEYLQMLEDVFAECVSKLEPGGRIAVNVANLGRKPYRSLSSDVIAILQDKLRLLLRGEVIWQKARGSAGSCAWGSFQRPTNPVLRDLTERVVIASKGRLDRVHSPRDRYRGGLPSETSISKDEFMEATTDVWEIPSESATRVGHPAPFPVELPERLIHLYTFRGDLVLDPFVGSGSTAVAAVRTGRHFAGYDTDPSYVKMATKRVAAEQSSSVESGPILESGVAIPAVPVAVPDGEDQVSRALREGRSAKEVAEILLTQAGFEDVTSDVRLPDDGLEFSFEGYDRSGKEWFFDLCGSLSGTSNGLRRAETLWKAIGKASVLHSRDRTARLILLATDLPVPSSPGDAALRSSTGNRRPIRDVIDVRTSDHWDRLAGYAASNPPRNRRIG